MKTVATLYLLLCLCPAANAKPTTPRPDVVSKTIKSSTKRAAIKLTYPQFPNADKKINAFFLEFVTDQKKAFLRDFGLVRNPNNQKNSLETYFTTYTVTPDIISVKMQVYTYTGGAHGNSNIYTFNKDAHTGGDFTLAALFPQTPDYLTLISSECRKQLPVMLQMNDYMEQDTRWLNNGTEPNEDNFSRFTFDKEGLYIHFSDYQVAPHAFGEPMVKITTSAVPQLRLPFEPELSKMSNPASDFCIAKGGILEIRKSPLGEYGVCIFEDNRQCEEWAMFRGECPLRGIKITGYTSDATVYCAITGHEAVEASEEGKDGTCTVQGVTCSAKKYYETGDCKP